MEVEDMEVFKRAQNAHFIILISVMIVSDQMAFRNN
jgi:hypothetical protein